ncbi:MATE family efflux transporter [Gangjinia marincola]|uniref:Multidrug-efflux transporter n=1 Tax=Gangjinia marincola TaxID=578463 RepID=A0ABP3XW48_9FLAO
MQQEVTFKRIHQLAIPAILAGIAEPLLSSTDAAVIGNIDTLPVESLAAVGIVGSFLSMLIWVLGQTRSAISTILSQHLGAGALEDVKVLPAQAIFFNLVLALIVLGTTYAFARQIFELLNASGEVLRLSLDYYHIRVWGFPLTLFTFAVFGIFRGLQNTYWPMIIAITGAVVNIGLDFALVYGVENIIPAMNIKGAAWASLISQGLMALLSFILLLKKTSISLKLVFPFHPEIKTLILMSLNLFLRTIALNLALILAVREATALGDQYIAAHAIAINIWFFSAFFLDGYGAAGNILGGKLIGAKNYQALWILAKRCVLYCLGMSLVLILLGVLFYEPLGLIFSKEAEVLAIFYGVFFMVLVTQPINAVAFTFDGIFKGLGKMKYLRNVLFASTFLGFIPMLYLSKHQQWGLLGIWGAFVVWIFIRAFVSTLKFRFTYLPLLKKQ